MGGVLLTLLGVLFLASCGGKKASKTDYSLTNGTYYLFADEELDKSTFFILADGKWQDEDGASGEYTIQDDKIDFNLIVSGETMNLCSGTIASYTLTITVGNITKIYKIDTGSIPVADNEVLLTPVLKADLNVISWDAVAGALGYLLTINGTEYNLSSDELNFTISNMLVGKYEISLIAKAKREKCNSLSANLEYDFDLFASGNGTSENPYGIATMNHLYNINYFPEASYIIEKNNSFNEAIFDGDTIEFKGHLTAEEDAVINNVTIKKALFNVNDGASITNLKFTNTSFEEASLINKNNGTVKNITIDMGLYTGSISYITPILINTNYGTVENSNVSGTAAGFLTAVNQNLGC